VIWNIFRAVFGGMSDHDGYQPNAPVTTPVKDVANITPDGAVQLAAVWACVDLLSRTMALLPCDVFAWDEDGKRHVDTKCNLHFLLALSPNAQMTAYDFWQTMTMYWALRGNAYALIRRNRDGTAYSLSPLNPDQMNVLVQNGKIIYQYYDRNQEIKEYGTDDILHWKCMGNGIIGLSKLEYMRGTVTEAVEAQSNAISIFANKGKINGLLNSSSVLNNKQKEEIAKQFARMRDGGIPVLPVELKFTQLSLSPADTELLSTRKFSVEEIARWFGIPVCLIQGEGSSDWDKAMRHFYKSTILPMCTALEQAIIKRVATSDERKKYAVKFRLSEVNRASDTERYQLYSQAVQNGILTRNEVRRMEGLEDVEGADKLTAQTNLLPVEDLGKQDASQEPQTTLTTEPQKQ